MTHYVLLLLSICQVLYCHMVQLRRAHAAMVKLNEFSRVELANEPLGDVSSSDSIFAGVFTLLSNLLTMPATTCASFTNMETIVSSSSLGVSLSLSVFLFCSHAWQILMRCLHNRMSFMLFLICYSSFPSPCSFLFNFFFQLESEQERIDLEWRAERMIKKQAYLEDVDRYEHEKNKETVPTHLISFFLRTILLLVTTISLFHVRVFFYLKQKKWKKLMRPEPTPLDLKALEAEFYARPDHAHLKSLQTLHSEAHQLLCRTLQELRAFVMAKDDEVRICMSEVNVRKSSLCC